MNEILIFISGILKVTNSVPIILIKSMKETEINCFNCIYFYVTWDDKFPRGCRAMDFKTNKIPSMLVRESSGMECTRFKAKKKSTPSK